MQTAPYVSKEKIEQLYQQLRKKHGSISEVARLCGKSRTHTWNVLKGNDPPNQVVLTAAVEYLKSRNEGYKSLASDIDEVLADAKRVAA